MRVRFKEYDEVFMLMQKNSPLLTYEQIGSILETMDFVDLTFIFVPIGEYFNVQIIDNNSEEELSLEELNIPAYDFYIKKLNDLKVKKDIKESEKINEQIKRIRDILNINQREGVLS